MHKPCMDFGTGKSPDLVVMHVTRADTDLRLTAASRVAPAGDDRWAGCAEVSVGALEWHGLVLARRIRVVRRPEASARA